jgi:hypothetical protein
MPNLTSVQFALLNARLKAKGRPAASIEPAVHTTSERDLHDAILLECRRRAFAVIHSRMDQASTIAVGAPDFVIAMPAGYTLWLEVKGPKGKPTPAQLAWLRHLEKLGHRAHLIRSLDEFVSLVSETY